MKRSQRDVVRVSSQRGAVRVSIVWMVTTLVLFFIALFLAYLGYDRAAKAEELATQARAQYAEGETRWQAEQKEIANLSASVGWYDATANSARTNLEVLGNDLKAMKETLGAGEDVRDLKSLVDHARTAVQSRDRDLASKQEELDQARMKALQDAQALRDSLAEKDKAIEDLRRQLADQTEAANQKQNEYETRIADLRNQISQLDADMRTAKATSEDSERKYQDEIKTYETRVNVFGQKLRFLKEPQAADGKVLAVSKELGIGYLDIGANNRLARGTRFTVVSGKSGSSKPKAMAEVLSVEPRRAEVRFLDVADEFDPVVAGDVVYNPVYDPSGERFAVLAGRFSGKYNERELTALLGQMGIKVQENLDLQTDYLIVGGELYSDADGNPLETPMQPTELPIYKDAESRGVQIMTVKDLQTYFAF